MKKLSKHEIQDIGGTCEETIEPSPQYPQVDNLFQRKVNADDALQDLLANERLAHNMPEEQIQGPKAFLLPSSKELLME